MPWTVLPQIDSARKHTHDTPDRIQGSCHDVVDAVVVQTSALLRRRGSEDMSTVAALITNTPHCVPCMTLLTPLDARRIYAALERLKADGRARLVSGTCARCTRATTVHVGGE